MAFPFLALPPELRDQVYRYTVSLTAIELFDPMGGLPITRASRQLRKESLAYLDFIQRHCSSGIDYYLEITSEQLESIDFRRKLRERCLSLRDKPAAAFDLCIAGATADDVYMTTNITKLILRLTMSDRGTVQLSGQLAICNTDGDEERNRLDRDTSWRLVRLSSRCQQLQYDAVDPRAPGQVYGIDAGRALRLLVAGLGAEADRKALMRMWSSEESDLLDRAPPWWV